MSDLTDVPRKRRIRARYLVLAGVVILLTLGMHHYTNRYRHSYAHCRANTCGRV